MKTPDRDMNVLTKTPEEIKRGILCDVPCEDCAYRVYAERAGGCSEAVTNDTLAYIQQLESRIAQVERERDALLGGIPQTCDTCKHARCMSFEEPCNKCSHLYRFNAIERGDTDNWQWRGVCEKNTKEEIE